MTSNVRKRATSAFGVVSISALLAALLWSGPAGAELTLPSAAQSAPTVAGAPFEPSALRTGLVLERLDSLEQLDTLELAQVALAERSTDASASSTARILASRIDALDRDLAVTEQALTPFNAETEEFGLEASVFPVASLRKPFFDDWGRPRSGGRTHKGNDMLAQIGVELRAIEDGHVERTTNGSLGGLSIYLIGESGARYYYAHLDEVGEFEEGETVYAGQTVGTIGDSGNARGAPHLHMQWAPDGESGWENPFDMLDVLYGQGASAEALAAVDELTAIESRDDQLSKGADGEKPTTKSQVRSAPDS